MKVTKDELQLPEYVCDSAEELAERYGSSVSTIRAEISRWKNGKRPTTRYMFVDLKDEDEI